MATPRAYGHRVARCPHGHIYSLDDYGPDYCPVCKAMEIFDRSKALEAENEMLRQQIVGGNARTIIGDVISILSDLINAPTDPVVIPGLAGHTEIGGEDEGV